MQSDAGQILSVLDHCCDAFTFPMLDNGYIYPAATRLSLYRSAGDWAMVIEVFGFSPRAGIPDTSIYTFASGLHDRKRADQYVNREAYERYLANNPNNEMRAIFPIAEGSWQDEEGEFIVEGPGDIVIRDKAITLPRVDEYANHGISLEMAPKVQVFEACRFVAAIAREQIFGTTQERRVNVPPQLAQVLQLEEWHHPNLVDGERPSSSDTFQQLAEILVTGDVGRYRPSQLPNTHWQNWPEAGRL